MRQNIFIGMFVLTGLLLFGGLVYFEDFRAKFAVGDCIVSKYQESWERRNIYHIYVVGNYQYHMCSTKYKCEYNYDFDDQERREVDRHYVKTECP